MPLPERAGRIIQEVSSKNGVVDHLAVGPLTWLRLLAQLCPRARCLTDIQQVHILGVPVYIMRGPNVEEDLIYVKVAPAPATPAQVAG
jgi:hypothetical protein